MVTPELVLIMRNYKYKIIGRGWVKNIHNNTLAKDRCFVSINIY